MASTSSHMDLSPEPDLHPLYPTTAQIAILLSSHSGLAPAQKRTLVTHCLARACVFGDLSILQYLLLDSQAQIHVDLTSRDEDGVGLISLTIHGFGAESERDVEREECVRFLIAQGADLTADNAGWTPLHHAALLSPPTLISHLMTHGCSPFAVTRRNLTPLDIVTAHSILPGRSDVALLLEESMRGEGWKHSRMEERRRISEQRMKRKQQRTELRSGVANILSINPQWWGSDSDLSSTDSESEDESENERVYTPLPDYSTMLVFSPPSLPHIFDSLITNYRPSLRDTTPANTLYMLARFACLICDHTWLEDLIIGATDTIEETFFNQADDITSLVFWLYNTTIWLHLLQCDNSINEACEILGSFELIEEVINSVFVFIIRFAERRVDQLLDIALLDFSSLGPDSEPIQFESEWSFLRPFSGKRRAASPNLLPTTPGARSHMPSSPPIPVRPLSPSSSLNNIPASNSRAFSSLRESFNRTRASSVTPLASMFSDIPPPPSPNKIVSFMTALNTLLTLSEINPVFVTQIWSQVMYWTSCEVFNRVITRKKYLCRSRAVQIGANIAALENWIDESGLPPGIQSHFQPVRNLLNWLQCLSSITEFSDLVATIQSMKDINPLQMRRAVRDYKYEVNESKMTEECVQYLTQLQKDWERHRVKLGVEALRKEIGERERDREESISFMIDQASGSSKQTPSISTTSSDVSATRHSIDTLFEGDEIITWEPVRPPQALGELLDSRYMLPLLLPSNPRMLAAFSRKQSTAEPHYQNKMPAHGAGRLSWGLKTRKLRSLSAGALQWVDGIRSATRWTQPLNSLIGDDDEDGQPPSYTSEDPNAADEELKIDTHVTPLTRKPSTRGKTRPSQGGETPVDHH
ncbi:DIL domain-containing protein [Infundibulicybe gibba]|nr:DIL domain-containing protein [Infundibulicybe gibba]